jgi:hypothetical protein
MAPEEKDDRKARLLGGAAGLSAIGGSDAGLGVPVRQILNMILEAGSKQFEEGSHGLPMFLVDRKTNRSAKTMADALKVARPEVIAGPASQMVHGTSPPRIQLKGSNRAILAHELGHHVKSPITWLANLADSPKLKGLGMGGGVAAAMSDSEIAQKAAPLIGMAPHIPELLEEARASMHGVRALHATEGLASAAKGALRLTPAFMTYMTKLIPALIAPYIAKSVMEYTKSKDPKKKNQKKTAGIKPPKATGKTILTARQRWAHPAPLPKTSKPGKVGTPKARPPSKSKFYKDMKAQLAGLGARRGS